jgi:hypothetical protein
MEQQMKVVIKHTLMIEKSIAEFLFGNMVNTT